MFQPFAMCNQQLIIQANKLLNNMRECKEELE
jgi:hypothetical protein